MGWVGIGLKFVMWIAGLCGFGNKDERDVERAAGEKLGREETENANAKGGLNEVRRAVQARERNSADLAVDDRRLLNGKDPAAAAYKPGAD